MSERAGISTRFPPGMSPGVVAVNAGLTGASPGGVLRYLAYRLAGSDPHAAREQVIPQRDLSAFNSRPRTEATMIAAEVVEAIRERFPGKSLSWLLRYQAAKENGADDALAKEIASSIVRGRPEGSKDVKPRVRRTRAELEAGAP